MQAPSVQIFAYHFSFFIRFESLATYLYNIIKYTETDTTDTVLHKIILKSSEMKKERQEKRKEDELSQQFIIIHLLLHQTNIFYLLFRYPYIQIATLHNSEGIFNEIDHLAQEVEHN